MEYLLILAIPVPFGIPAHPPHSLWNPDPSCPFPLGSLLTLPSSFGMNQWNSQSLSCSLSLWDQPVEFPLTLPLEFPFPFPLGSPVTLPVPCGITPWNSRSRSRCPCSSCGRGARSWRSSTGTQQCPGPAIGECGGLRPPEPPQRPPEPPLSLPRVPQSPQSPPGTLRSPPLPRALPESLKPSRVPPSPP